MAGLSDPNLLSKLTTSLNGLYAGTYLAGVFYGLTTHQTFVYFRRSRRDPIYTRLLASLRATFTPMQWFSANAGSNFMVSSLKFLEILLEWFEYRILDTLHAVLAAVALRKLTEESIVNPLSILSNTVPWTMTFSLFMMSLGDSGVRGFYCYRIWRLSQKNWILTSVAIFPVICALVAGLYCTSRTVKTTGLQALDLVDELDATLISICVADSILAGFLCVLLWNSRSGIRRTNSVISTLILYTVTTGLLTTVVAIATLIIMLSMKETFAYAGAFYMLSKLYFSSLLATLNRREKIRTQMDATSGIISVPLQTSNSRGLKGTGSNLGGESCTSQSSTSRQQQNDSEYQVGGVELELGLCSKSSLRHGVENKVETDMVQSHESSVYEDPKEDHDSDLACQAASMV
ncbi:hypothetical protein K438DRAFT_558916 [Mycena galopus ATCC 62051]|nr:hypothetical protein K438DRAFT_558916 [Mycena galopus ATCC 62051]